MPAAVGATSCLHRAPCASSTSKPSNGCSTAPRWSWPQAAAGSPWSKAGTVSGAESKWRTNVSHYAQVMLAEVYPGIDAVYYGNQRQLEYDVVAQPMAKRSVGHPTRAKHTAQAGEFLSVSHWFPTIRGFATPPNVSS